MQNSSPIQGRHLSTRNSKKREGDVEIGMRTLQAVEEASEAIEAIETIITIGKANQK